MKKIFLAVLVIVVAAMITMAGSFYWRNVRGVWPAVGSPPRDIAAMVNTSGMPLTLPPGFAVSIFASGLGHPRALCHDSAGNLLASITAEGKVVALPDRNHDGVADEIVTVVEGLDRPHGMATYGPGGRTLYIAESDEVAAYDYDQKNLKAVNKRKIVDLPDDGMHFSRTILFMPPPNERRLLISVGSDCNACIERDWRRAKILVCDADGGEPKAFASGLRNAVFMAVHPATKQIWATEMGRDWLGDNEPPDEIDIIEEGKNYGWPTCYGKNVHDTEFDHNVYVRNPCMEPFETPSYIDIPAHSAPLGLAFFPEEGWPAEYRHDLLVAYHGSWNRTVPTGYKVVRFHLDARGNYLGAEDFITGWLVGERKALGRPVDVSIEPGGVIYISDDKAGLIYRVVYKGIGTVR